MTAEFDVRRATKREFAAAVGWAEAEGWNPGIDDLDPFFAADPDGFFMGFLDGEPVSSISVVRYGNAYGFLGFYIVHPDFRSGGYGLATWNRGMAHLAGRTIGLDGVVAQQENYRKSGFEFAGRNIRYYGVPSHVGTDGPAVAIDAATPDHWDRISEFDRHVFGTPRDPFLHAWIFASPEADRQTVVALEREKIVGYATVRKCVTGYKVGPLFAGSTQVARALLNAVCSRLDGKHPVALDVPEDNGAGVAMAQEAGLAPVFETARMYRGPAPNMPPSLIFGVTTFELG